MLDEQFLTWATDKRDVKAFTDHYLSVIHIKDDEDKVIERLLILFT